MVSKAELLATQLDGITDADETNANKVKSSELVNVKHIVNTPFTIVRTHDGTKNFIAMGNARLSEYKETMEECEEMVNCKSWELIMAMCGRIAELTYNEKIENNA